MKILDIVRLCSAIHPRELKNPIGCKVRLSDDYDFDRFNNTPRYLKNQIGIIVRAYFMYNLLYYEICWGKIDSDIPRHYTSKSNLVLIF